MLGKCPIVASYIVTFLKPEMLHLYRQVTALREFKPVVFTQRRENADTFPFSDIVVVPKPRTHQLRRFWQKTLLHRPITIYRSEARRLLATIHASGAALLHVYFGHIGVHLLPLLEIADLPVIVSFHGADSKVGLENPAHLASMQRVLQLATLVLVRSDSLRERLLEIGCAAEKIRLNRTGIPLSEINFKPRTPPADGAWRFVQASRLIEKKGLPTSLRAFASFREKYPLAKFTICGEGPLQPQLEALAASLGIAEAVRFTGFLSQQQLREEYAAAHFFLHPSQTGPNGDQEGVPNSMLEAMASGLPIAATTHGGILEAVQHGISGLLVPERDDEGLAAALLSLAANADAFTSMSHAAHEAAADFDIDRQRQLLEASYREALATKHQGCCGVTTR